MGKDNVPFHTIIFPAMIMGTGENWKKVDRLKGFNYLNYDGASFSTSGQSGIERMRRWMSRWRITGAII